VTLNIMREVNILIHIRPQSGTFTIGAGSLLLQTTSHSFRLFELKKEKEKV